MRIRFASTVALSALLGAVCLGAPARAQEAAPPGSGDFTSLDAMPEVLHKVAPAYPLEARQAGVEGTVRVKVLVGADGRVKEATVLESVPLLDEAALECVRQWTFKPALRDGQPVAVWVAAPVRFTMERSVPKETAAGPQDSLRAGFDRGFAALYERGAVAPSAADSAERAALIRTALAMAPPPRLPDAAQERFERGRRAYERCSCRDSMKSALASFEKALHEAPWWGPPYLAAGRMLQKLDRPDEALVSYRLYLLAEPDALQAEQVLKDMMKLELKLARKR